jgi:hypothetical protein
MKTLKISLATIIGIAICVTIYFWIQKVQSPKEIKPPVNQFTEKVEKEISNLEAKSNDQFYRKELEEIKFLIKVYHKDNRFGNTSENNQWKEILEKNLYSVYADKFVKRTQMIFSGSEWNPDDIRSIQSEKIFLKESKKIDVGSPIDNEFSNIQVTLNQYYKIVSFISSCKGFKFLETSLSERFPIDEVQNKISQAQMLLQTELGNEYVYNCTRLHEELKEIPQILFQAHVNYLNRKIDYWSETYKQYRSQADYSNNLYKPLKSEIDLLDNEMYNQSSVEREYYRLTQKWSSDNTKAYNYKY